MRRNNMLTYDCPYGKTRIYAKDKKELTEKIGTHSVIAHGTYAIIVCPARRNLPAVENDTAVVNILRSLAA